jgi:glycosyltransferase involved in cell wall biosynthesis
MMTTYPSPAGGLGGVADYAKSLVDALPGTGYESLVVLAQYHPAPTCSPAVPAWQPGSRLKSTLEASLSRYPVEILHIQHEPFLYGRSATLSAVTLARRARKRRIKCILTLHALPFPSLLHDRSARTIPIRLLSSAFVAFIGQVESSIDTFIVHEVAQAACLTDRARVPVSKIEVIPHGISILPDSAPDPSRRPFTIGTFGYLSPYKDPGYLLDEFKRFHFSVPDSRLLFSLSPHPLRTGVLHRRRHRGLMERAAQIKGVTAFDYIAAAELAGFLRSCDVIVTPYKYAVSSSGVVAAAAGAGTPSLVPQGCAAPGDLAHWTFPYSPGGLATALERHVGRTASLRAEARAIARSRSWSRVAAMHKELYLRLG